MKRYLLSMLLIVLSIGGISGYYVYTAADRLPEYQLIGMEGNPELAETLELSGSYGGRMRSKFLNVSTEGSSYQNNDSTTRPLLYESERSWFLRQPGIKQLAEEHRDFLRGKGTWARFYIDEDWLICAEPVSQDGNTIRLELLDLKSGQRKRFEAAIPEQQGLSHPYVADVQRLGDEIHMVSTFLVVQTQVAHVRPSEIYFDSVIDLKQGATIKQEQLNFGLDVREDEDLSISWDTGNSLGPREYLLFQVRVTKPESERSDTLLSRQLYSYSFKTGELKELNLDVREEQSITQSDGRYAYVVEQDVRDRKQADIRRYDLSAGKLDKELEISAEQLGGDRIYTVLTHEDKIYILLHHNQVPQVVVLNADDGAVVYRGEVVHTESGERAAEAMKQLRLLNMNFKR
jgi:hypothetical protein